MIMVDTTVWVDFFRGAKTPEHRALERLISSDRQLICVTDIIQTEILQGIVQDKQHARTRHFLGRLPCLTARAPNSYLHAAELYRRCRKKGATIRSTIDCLIAAVCLENGSALLHHDSDFNHLARHCGLKTVAPAAILSNP